MQLFANSYTFSDILTNCYKIFHIWQIPTIPHNFLQFLTISKNVLQIVKKTIKSKQILTIYFKIFTNLYKFLQFLEIFWQILVHSNSFLKFITNSYQFKYFLTISDNFWPILTNFNICLQSLILSYNFLLFLTISFLMNSYKFSNS